MSLRRVYLHYPFCLTLCRYCNFSAGAPPKEEFTQPYLEALIKEIQHFGEKFDLQNIAKDSFYFGGGTPSLMPEKNFEKIFDLIPLHKNTEVTLEINPETVTKEKARFWKSIGINRVSLGWQSMNPKTLSFLGRSGNHTDNLRSFELLREAGFDNISVDRILSVKNDTDTDFLEALQTHTPDHISTYQLSIEAKTVLHFWTKTKKYFPTTDFDAINIEQKTHRALTQLGFEQYETSNYHKNNKKGQHNLGYWNYEYWLGLGAGASGFIPNDKLGFRYRNQFSFKDYLKNPLFYEEEESIDFKTAIKEALMLGIRKREGIIKKDFEKRFYNQNFCSQNSPISWQTLFPNGIPQEYFEETKKTIILKQQMIPFTNPATVALWESLSQQI
ncbi:MAG: radical SAM family heme chaperone HemW [Brevinema sp.]